MAQDVVTGFPSPDNKARERPVGVAIDKTGALLIADEVGNTVWRRQMDISFRFSKLRGCGHVDIRVFEPWSSK
jgi:hypothetical protein